MWNKKIIAIVDKKSINTDILSYVKKLVNANIDILILKSDNLSEFEYYDIAKEVISICSKKNVQCILHKFDRQSLKLNHKFFHAPLSLLEKEPRLYRHFHFLGTSVYSKEELIKVTEYKVNYAFVGDIFTDDKKDFLDDDELDLLKSLLNISKIPVYLKGGINLNNIKSIKDLNIAGICMKNAFFKMENNLKTYIKECKNLLNE